MKHRIGAALAMAAMLTVATLLPAAATADDQAAAASRATTEQLQQDLEARAQKDAEAMASDAMTAASDLELPLHIERVSPRALVLVSDI